MSNNTNMSNNTKLANPMKVITGKDTHWSYANVWEAKSINGGTERPDDPAYVAATSSMPTPLRLPES